MPKLWTPPGRWTTAIPNRSWYRIDTPDRATVCAVIPPRERPAMDGGDWTDDELWTATVPIEDGDLAGAPGPRTLWAPGWIYTMYDKPHRLSSALDEPDCHVLARVPLPAELVAAVAFDDIADACTVGPVHRGGVRCRRYFRGCQRRHRWRGYCPCGWRVTRGRFEAANRGIDEHLERTHA